MLPEAERALTIAFYSEVGQSMDYILGGLDFESCEQQGVDKVAELVCGRPREDVFAGRAATTSDCDVARRSSSLLDCCRPPKESAIGGFGECWSKPEALFDEQE
jgi:hypothetical protein